MHYIKTSSNRIRDRIGKKKIETLTKLFNRFYQPKTIKTQAKKKFWEEQTNTEIPDYDWEEVFGFEIPNFRGELQLSKTIKSITDRKKPDKILTGKKSMYKVQWIFFKGTTFKGTFSKNEEEHNTRCTTYKQREENQRGTNKKILRKKSKGIWNFWSNN